MKKLKTVKVQGRDYVLVADRVLAFNEACENGSITTELVSTPDAPVMVVKATITPDCSKPERKFTGYSQADKSQGNVNKTAALENCETSAVGRALGMMGIGIVESIASADEVNKAVRSVPVASTTATSGKKEAVGKFHCDNTQCAGTTNFQNGLCYTCFKAVQNGSEIKFKRSEGAVSDADMPLTPNGAPKF